MPPISISANEFFPTASLTGGESPSVFRGRNAVIRGQDTYPYIEPYSGSLDLNETYDLTGEVLTGTISWVAGSAEITGVGTDFAEQLRPGQKLLAGTEIIAVNRVTDAVSLTADREMTTTASTQTAYFLPNLFEVAGKRGSLRRGNAIKIDKGDIIFTGDGDLRLNGSKFLNNDGTTVFPASIQPKRLQRAVAGTYTPFPIGFNAPPPIPVITVVTDGVKKMMNGKYSFLLSYYNSVTKGYSNPTEAIKLDSAGADIEITSTGSLSRFRFDFTDSLVGLPTNADGFVLWGTSSGGGVAETNATNFNNGAWYKVKNILVSELDANDKIFVEYLDSELGSIASGNNDAPPECDFVCEFANVPFYLSALGNKKNDNPLGTSPGNYALPTKNGNREAAPIEWATSVGDEIRGFALGVGRMFCLTDKGIPFITPTGNTEVARLLPTLSDYPFTSRPFWTKGGISPYNICVVQGDVFAFTGGQPLMSPRNITDQNFSPFQLGAKIRDIIKDWKDGYNITIEDPKNQQVCFMQAATRKNNAGYWESDILPYNLQTNTWMPPIVVSSQFRDMVISGAAIVNNRLEFLAGGRRSTGAPEMRTYRYDERSGEAVSGYFSTQFSDFGMERRAKKITRQRITGRFSTLTMQIHGADYNSRIISLDNLESGTASLSGDITFTGNGSEIERSLEVRHLTKGVDIGAVRVAFSWDGTGEPDRIDEIVLEIEQHGRER